MMVENDIVKYNALRNLSILDYYNFIEMVSRNMSKMQTDGKGQNNLSS